VRLSEQAKVRLCLDVATVLLCGSLFTSGCASTPDNGEERPAPAVTKSDVIAADQIEPTSF